MFRQVDDTIPVFTESSWRLNLDTIFVNEVESGHPSRSRGEFLSGYTPAQRTLAGHLYSPWKSVVHEAYQERISPSCWSTIPVTCRSVIDMR